MTNQQAVEMILAEVDRAEAKHPNWPADFIHGAAIVGEESGELIRAALQHKYEKGNPHDMIMEAIHTAATCIRFLRKF